MNNADVLKSIPAAGLALLALCAPAQSKDAGIPFMVRIENVTAGAGPVRVAMFDRETWLGRAVAAGEVEASSHAVEMTLNAPRAGAYGFVAYQDIDRDGRLDRNIFGIPTEPTAFSNGAEIFFGPPDFDSAAVTIDAGSQALLRLEQ